MQIIHLFLTIHWKKAISIFFCFSDWRSWKIAIRYFCFSIFLIENRGLRGLSKTSFTWKDPSGPCKNPSKGFKGIFFSWTSLTAHAVVSRFSGYKSKSFSYKWPSITLGLRSCLIDLNQRFQWDGTVQLFGTKGQKFHDRSSIIVLGQRDNGTS